MRDRPQPLIQKAIAKVRREGGLETLRQAPTWLLGTAIEEAVIGLKRKHRRLRYRRIGFHAIPDPDSVIEIDPQTVTHLVPFSRFGDTHPRTLLGTVRGGDWDRGVPLVENQVKYQACRSRVVDGVSWEDTGIVDHLAAELDSSDSDTIEHGCGSREALLARYESTRETLFRQLHESGYDRSISPVCCRVHIGRDGALLLGDGGHHRFYLSRLLDIDSIPVQVLCRHREWQSVRDSVAKADTTDDIPPSVQTHIDHPDLRELWPTRTSRQIP